MTSPLPPPTDPVFIRTVAGQDAVFDRCIDLDTSARRLLLLVNGFTALGDLATRLPNPDSACEHARVLQERRLIAEVP